MSAARARPLVVAADDEPDALELVRLSFARAGFDVRTATNGADALRLAREEVPDACVLDVGMPGLDGFALTRRIREDPRAGAIPIVLLTAAARVTDEAEGLAAGADAYLTKPFSPTVLVDRVRTLITRSAAPGG